jgi:DNA modification methylase
VLRDDRQKIDLQRASEMNQGFDALAERVVRYSTMPDNSDILFGDCLDVMKSFQSNSIDLIVTSPPYADARKHTYGGVSPDDYVEWFTPRAEQIYRILKPTGSLILNLKEKAVNGQRHTYILDLILALKNECNFRWVEEYIWHKKTSAPGKWKYRFRDAWERILHFSKEKDFKMRQDAVKVPIGDWAEKRLRNMSSNDLKRQESATKSKIGRKISAWAERKTVYPSNVLHKSPVTHNAGHSAAFPEWLPEFFIKLLTDEGDRVLDPFVGSGTTFRVAQQMNRVAWGIEIDRKCQKRLLELL